MVIELEKSNLEILLEKNAYGMGLSAKERLKAVNLIINPMYSDEYCWICSQIFNYREPMKSERAIYDTGLCQIHALYALSRRK